MGSQLADRVAVITGGASGIGRATVLRFLSEGASVVVGDLNAEVGKDLVDEAGEPERLTFIRTDVAEEHDVAALIGAATERYGRLDVVFNNAGSGGAFGPITDIAVEHWDRTFAILTRGVFLGIKHGAKAMIAQGTGGSIINTASIAGLVGGSGPQAYSAAKAAVVNLTLNAAVELAPHRIRVNAICPGVIFTPLAAGANKDQMVEMVSALQPWPDHGAGADIAGLRAVAGRRRLPLRDRRRHPRRRRHRGRRHAGHHRRRPAPVLGALHRLRPGHHWRGSREAPPR